MLLDISRDSADVNVDVRIFHRPKQNVDSSRTVEVSDVSETSTHSHVPSLTKQHSYIPAIPRECVRFDEACLSTLLSIECLLPFPSLQIVNLLHIQPLQFRCDIDTDDSTTLSLSWMKE